MTHLKDPTVIVNISGFLDLVGVSLILPLILPHVRSLGTSATVAGIFGSVYGALQLVSSPMVGSWSDTVGRRVTLLVCLVVTGLGYCMMGLSASIAILCVARIPGGIFKHSQTISKSYLADVTTKERRPHAFGQFNAASNVGFILGPVVGGHLAELPGGFAIVGMLAGLTFLANAVLIWWFLPSTNPTPHPEILRQDSVVSLKKLDSEEYSFSFREMFRSVSSIHWSNLWDLFLIKFFLGFSVIVFRSSFSLFASSQFDASPRIIGYLTSFSSLVATACGFFVGDLAKYYDNDGRLFFHMAVIQAATLLCITISPSIVWLAFFLCPLSVTTSVMRVIGTSLTIHKGGDSDKGALMGFSQSVMSVARMLSPFLGGVAMEISMLGPAWLGTTFAMIAVCLLIIKPQDSEKEKLKRL